MSEFIDWLIAGIKWCFDLVNPDRLKELVHSIGEWWVYTVLFAIVFAETGLLIGFCLPGDSLLFTAGMLCSQDVLNIVVVNVGLIIAAIVGDAVNYFLGRQMGEYVFEKGRLRFVRHEHLLAARDFYEKHGAIAIVLARFVPIVRTFTPFVAGVARMGYRKFAFYNITGGIGWVLSMTLFGYFVGNIPWVRENFEKVVIGIVILSVMPIVISGGKSWLQNRNVRPKECRLYIPPLTGEESAER